MNKLSQTEPQSVHGWGTYLAFRYTHQLLWCSDGLTPLRGHGLFDSDLGVFSLVTPNFLKHEHEAINLMFGAPCHKCLHSSWNFYLCTIVTCFIQLYFSACPWSSPVSISSYLDIKLFSKAGSDILYPRGFSPAILPIFWSYIVKVDSELWLSIPRAQFFNNKILFCSTITL